MHGGKGKGLTPVSFHPLLWLAEDFGGPLALSSGLGVISNSVFASLSYRAVGPRGTLAPRLVYANAVGLAIGLSPEEFNEILTI